jgi:hypothetical protein
MKIYHMGVLEEENDLVFMYRPSLPVLVPSLMD